jgi:hypothetical protein
VILVTVENAQKAPPSTPEGIIRTSNVTDVANSTTNGFLGIPKAITGPFANTSHENQAREY